MRRLGSLGSASPLVLWLLLVPLALALLAGCREEAAEVVPESLPETLPDDRIPAAPTLSDSTAVDLLPGEPTSALRLRSAGEVGDATTFRIAVQQRIRHVGTGLPQSESESHHELRRTSRVVTNDGREIAREHTLSKVTVSVTPDLPDVAKNLREKLEGLRYTTYEDDRGDIVRVVPGEASGPEQAQLLQVLAAELLRSSFILPEGPVTAGATWSQQTRSSLALTAGGSVPVSVDTTYTLRGLATIDGRRVAVVDVELMQRAHGRFTAEGNAVETTGAGRGVGVVFFDVEDGQIRASELAVATTQELLVRRGDERHLLVQHQTHRTIVQREEPGEDA